MSGWLIRTGAPDSGFTSWRAQNRRKSSLSSDIASVVCVQNFYNLAHREDDDLVAVTAEQGIAYVPYFLLGGFSPLQSSALSSVAQELGATPMSVALAWLLQRSPNMLLIPGTSSVDHLRENVAGAGLDLPDEAVRRLDTLSGRHNES